MKEKTINILKICLTFFIIIITFFILMLLSCLLPKDKIKANASSAVFTFSKEGTYNIPFFEPNYILAYSMRLDNFMDAVILNVAVDNESKLSVPEKSVSNMYYHDEKIGPVKSFENVFKENAEANQPYVRYWFGTIPLIRLLLVFMQYQNIRYLNMIALFLLLAITIIAIERKIGIKYAIAYMISISLCGIIIIPMSLQFSPMFYITFGASLAVTLLYDKKSFKNICPYIFLMIGSLTAFCDLLTAPLMSFGIPIILLMILRKKNNNYTLKENIIFIVKLGIIWILSYAMTYLAKWLIASVILQNNEVEIAWNKFMFRVDKDNEYGKISTIYQNFKTYFNNNVLIGLGIFTVIYCAIAINKKYYKNIDWKHIFIILCISIVPYLWYLVLTNHSGIHFWMTYRIQSITMFGLLSAILSFSDKKIDIKKT